MTKQMDKTVIQADRDAAISLFELVNDFGDGEWIDGVRFGRLDDDPYVQFIFCHRLDSIARLSSTPIPGATEQEEYMTVTLSKDGVVRSHNAFDADFDDMVRATQTIVTTLQARLSNRKYCPYSHGGDLKIGALPIPGETGELVERLWELLAKATQGDWEYRPDEYDDWGFIRGPEADFSFGRGRPIVAMSRDGADRGDHSEHRRNGTDPYEDNGRLIVEAKNALPTLLTELEAAKARIREEYARGLVDAAKVAHRREELLQRANADRPRAEHRQRGLEAHLIAYAIEALKTRAAAQFLQAGRDDAISPEGS